MHGHHDIGGNRDRYVEGDTADVNKETCTATLLIDVGGEEVVNETDVDCFNK